jgi:hypothetical protein
MVDTTLGTLLLEGVLSTRPMSYVDDFQLPEVEVDRREANSDLRN